MKWPLILLTVFFATMTCAKSQGASKVAQAIPMSYELYSWQSANDTWEFCVLASPSGVNVSAQQVFNKKFTLRGLAGLKQKISLLPVGATIFWPDRISLSTGEKARESAKLSYPPSSTVQEIKQFAEARKIRIEVLSFPQKKSGR